MLDQGPIVVPLDGSTNAEAAVAPALRLARTYNAPIHFLHVVDLESREPAATPQIPDGRLQDRVQTLLHQADESSVDWSATIHVGAPAQTILNVAQGARLIVMATHGRGGFQTAFIGSVTDKVVRSCQFPVLTVPVTGFADLTSGPVLVGLDGSTTAEAALPVARDLASRLGVGIALIRAYSMMVSTGSEFVAYEYDTVGILKDAAEHYLSTVALAGERQLTAMASPAVAIAETAQQVGAGLVVLTSHGRGLAYRLALGSTTDRVIHSVRRPILMLPGAQG